MSRLILLVILSIWCCQPIESNEPDFEQIAAELDSMYELDQQYRNQIMELQTSGENSDELQMLWRKQMVIDSSNLNRVLQIIEVTGTYPGRSLVGDKAASATYFILQHSPDSIQVKYFELITEAARDGELKRSHGAMYTDRYLMYRGEPQLYGSQIRSDMIVNPETGEKTDSMFVWPIADTTNIDSLRAMHGMQPLEEYLEFFGLSRWDSVPTP